MPLYNIIANAHPAFKVIILKILYKCPISQTKTYNENIKYNRDY